MNNCIGENIRYWRKSFRMTQAELAKASGVSREAIGYYESGKRHPPMNIAGNIAKALGVTLNALLVEYADGQDRDVVHEALSEKASAAVGELSPELDAVKILMNRFGYDLSLNATNGMFYLQDDYGLQAVADDKIDAYMRDVLDYMKYKAMQLFDDKNSFVAAVRRNTTAKKVGDSLAPQE